MANRIDALLSGVGSLQEVADAQGVNQLIHGDTVADLLNACKCISETIDAGEVERRVAFVMIAALLNTQFEKSGYLWNCDDKGNLERNYHGDNPRKVIAALMTA